MLKKQGKRCFPKSLQSVGPSLQGVEHPLFPGHSMAAEGAPHLRTGLQTQPDKYKETLDDRLAAERWRDY